MCRLYAQAERSQRHNVQERRTQRHPAAQVRAVFKRAVEEGRELLDRRQGRAPATRHEPVDFLTERVEYDASLVAMEFDEQFKPLPDTQAAAMSASGAVAALRACARRPDAGDSVPGAVGSLLMWHRFHTAPESVRKKTCARLAGAVPAIAGPEWCARRLRVRVHAFPGVAAVSECARRCR